MRDPHEPSMRDHGAPYNEDDDGRCDCYYCQKRKRQEHEEDIADLLYEQERERRWLKGQ